MKETMIGRRKVERIRHRMRQQRRQAIWAALLGAVALPGAVTALVSARPAARTQIFREAFSSGNLDAWEFPHPEDWEILSDGPLHYLHMKRSREPGVPRRPLQFALAKLGPVESFELLARVRREGRSMIVVFGYVDTLHFYYAHLSMDRGTNDPVHNGIFIVNGGPRKCIAGLDAGPALPDTAWHTVRIAGDVSSGRIQVFMDGQKEPSFSVEDHTFACGRIGVGSFDETGDFADIRVFAHGVGCVPAPIPHSGQSR
jgi:hypothetical protein